MRWIGASRAGVVRRGAGFHGTPPQTSVRAILAILVDGAGNALVDSEGRALVAWVNQSEAS
ncbi:hypothetical protein [Cereibacter azotoformans]|uniref:hypothetical protein n=1 Tax=Cereibacter azotoformans TaxID=43057 RepID=UPI000C6CF1D5|nr:hypothetical protein [Cereibacter azotoformans]